jgi:flagellar biosynthesis GTPase FlhF
MKAFFRSFVHQEYFLALAEQINTLDQLRGISDESWEKLSKIPEVVKRFIIDYIKLNMDTVSNSFNQQAGDPYKTSKATLLADIHRVRRYFYYVIKKIDSIPYLSREVVDLAIEEVKKTYDDDGNILINIQNYLRTFCLENRFEDEAAHQKKKRDWQEEFDDLQVHQLINNEELSQIQNELVRLETDIKVYEKRKENRDWTRHVINNYDLSTRSDYHRVLSERSLGSLSEENRPSNTHEKGIFQKIKDAISGKRGEVANSMQKKNETWKIKCENEALEAEFNAKIQEMKDEYKRKTDEHWNLDAKTANNKVQMGHLENLLQMDWKEQEKKLTVKYGRGLLLFGPPGTGE